MPPPAPRATPALSKTASCPHLLIVVGPHPHDLPSPCSQHLSLARRRYIVATCVFGGGSVLRTVALGANSQRLAYLVGRLRERQSAICNPQSAIQKKYAAPIV